MAGSGKPLDLKKDVERAVELLEKLKKSGNVPVAKLSALQKTLQSDFMSTVREVYEHVHKTINIQDAPDVRAAAASKATVAAFAASEGHAHPRVVELPVTKEGLGFDIYGGQEQNFPICVSRLTPNSAADEQAGLKRGDQLLAINGVCVEGESCERAMELLEKAQGSVKLLVRYTPKVLEEIEMTLDEQCAAQVNHQNQ